MARTLRPDDQETEALRERAHLEGRSMQEVARQAVRDYIERTSRRDSRVSTPCDDRRAVPVRRHCEEPTVSSTS